MNISFSVPETPKAQAGISMVELLVAMIVGAFLLAGVIQVYVANVTASTAIAGFSDQQENTRVADHNLTYSLRSAGHYGGVAGTEVSNLGALGITGIGGCDEAWITNAESPLEIFQGAATIGAVAGFPANCIDADHYVPNSDIIVVRYGTPDGWASIGSLSADTVYLRSAVTGGQTGGEILINTLAGSTAVGGGIDGVGIYNYRYQAEVYHLRPCSVVVAGACNDGIPTLVKIALDGRTFTAQAVAEGIEQLQVVQDDDFAEFSLVTRSDRAEPGYSDAGSYAMSGGYDYTPDASDQKYRRKLANKLIQLRNISRAAF